jgi:hypothetical protein
LGEVRWTYAKVLEVEFWSGQLTPESRSQKAEARTGVGKLGRFFEFKKKTKKDKEEKQNGEFNY